MRTRAPVFWTLIYIPDSGFDDMLQMLNLQVRAILVDPSCSGSGTAVDRLDHLLPSYKQGRICIVL